MNDKNIVNINKFDYNNIFFDKICNFYKSYKKIDVYNLNSNQSLQKLWIKITNVKLYTSIYEKNNNSFIVFNNNHSDNIMKFINKIDKKIKKHFKSYKLNLKKTIIDKIPFNIMKINLPKVNINNSTHLSFNIYNHNNKLINPKILEKGCKISCFLELSEIWISETNIGCNWNVLQMKIYPELLFNKCMFYDEEPIQIKNETECFHCLNCIHSNNSHNTTPIIQTNNIHTVNRQSISLHQLNNVKNNLKSSNITNNP